MELLIAGVVGYLVVSIQEWIADVRFYRRRTKKELDRIRRSLGKVDCVEHTLPTGEVEELGPGKVYVFGGSKVGTVTGVVSEEEMIDEAERLIKKAHNRTIAPSQDYNLVRKLCFW